MDTVNSTPATPTLAAQARLYVGQREKPGNSGFHDPAFEKAMKAVGWWKGAAWCAFFVRLCVRMAGYQDRVSPSAVQTWKQYKAAGLTGSEPRVDSIACWQTYESGKATPRGHVGIVSRVGEKLTNGVQTIEVIEGNTNAYGSREGDSVVVKTRKVDFTAPTKGLRLLGFCYPQKVAA